MSHVQLNVRPIKLAAILSVLLFTLLALATAQAAPAAETAASSNFTVVADGLANPRGIVFDESGNLYVAEAGSGGEGVCIEGAEGPLCFGSSGAVTKVTMDENRSAVAQSQVVTGLPSLGAPTTGDAATGPHAVAFDAGGEMVVITGLGGPPSWQDPAGPLGASGAEFGWLMTADPVVDSYTPWVNLAAYEASEDPDGDNVDSNPFGMVADGSSLAVTDAGGNSLLAISDSGSIATEAIFPARMVEFPPGSGSMMPMQAVPTGVRVGPDGATYVGQLTGFPFPVGGANVWRVPDAGDAEVYEGGFSSILGIDFAADGSLYVLEMFANGQLSGDPTGAVIHVATDGTRTVLASEGLITPTGLTVGPDGAVYVSNFGVSGSMGQVVRIPTPASEAPKPVMRTITVEAAKDNTLYENETGSVSNGQGEYLFAGNTKDKGLRRALVAFDLGSVPPVANVISATLSLTVSKSVVAGESPVAVHAVQADWGEGASDAPGEEGGGAAAEMGDATWLHTFFDTDMWTNPGGDFAPVASATTTVAGSGAYAWSSPELVADVAGWASGNTANNGWAVLGDEGGETTAKRYDSRQTTEGQGPTLTITYELYQALTPVVVAP